MPKTITTKIQALVHKVSLSTLNYKKMVVMISIIVTVSVPIVYKLTLHFNILSYSKSVFQITSSVSKHEALYYNPFSNSSISLERDVDCNLNKKTSCHTVNKSLVVTFWKESSRDKWLAKNILRAFPGKNFDRIIMVHDNSSWSSYPNKELLIWIHVHSQKRFWYIKRFLTTPILRAYRYIWIVDDDVQLLFEPLHYECVIRQLNISLSSPSLSQGAYSHFITRPDQNFINKIGRWTDFVEIGPVVVGSSMAWECISQFLSPFVGLGYGLDLIWCRLLAHHCGTNSTMYKTCAILDIFQMKHLTQSIGSGEVGMKEVPAYDQYYKNFNTQQRNFNPLANNLTIHSSCIQS